MIDALGTLGGVFEIIFWSIMLVYGSIRKNMLIFSIMNRLARTGHEQYDGPSAKDEQNYISKTQYRNGNRTRLSRVTNMQNEN